MNEADEERNSHREGNPRKKPYTRGERVRKTIDQPSRDENARADAYAEHQRVPDRDLIQRHRFLAHQEERGKAHGRVGDELGGARSERDEGQRRARREHPKR